MNVLKKLSIDKNKYFFIEGKKKVLDLAGNDKIYYILCNSEFYNDKNNFDFFDKLKKNKIDFKIIKDKEFRKLSSTKTPQGVIGVFNKQSKTITTFFNENLKNIIILDSIQDPGNLGTILRNSSASGFKNIIIGNGSVNLYNEKVLSAFTGNINSLNIIEHLDLKENIVFIKKKGFRIIVTDIKAGKKYFDYEYPEKFALIFGSEGKGVDKNIQNLADVFINIPLKNEINSINVGVASGIIMFDYKRRYN